MSDSVKRYHVNEFDDLVADAEGDWVLYEDFEALRARLGEVEGDLHEAADVVRDLQEQLTLARQELAGAKESGFLAGFEAAAESLSAAFARVKYRTKENAGG